MQPTDLEARLNLHFGDKELLRTAFVHSSFINEAPNPDELTDNERLEFLGDAIIGFVVSEYLYSLFPALREGELTSIRAALVQREALARFARELQLGEFLQLGRGEEESGGRRRTATLCATFEALIGAIYLDQGIDGVREFVRPIINRDLPAVKKQALAKDPKTRLQEWAQGELGSAPRYKVLESSGPDHDKIFVTQVTIGHRRVGVGRGKSKQRASQSAAAMALHILGMSAPEYVHDDEVEVLYPVVEPEPRSDDGADGQTVVGSVG